MNRPALHMTALEAATKTYNYVASLPKHADKAPAELRAEARELLGGMIRKGAFIITDAR